MSLPMDQRRSIGYSIEGPEFVLHELDFDAVGIEKVEAATGFVTLLGDRFHIQRRQALPHDIEVLDHEAKVVDSDVAIVGRNPPGRSRFEKR